MSPRRRQTTEDADQDDPTFTALPAHLQRTIDRAFDNARTSSANPTRKRRKLDAETTPRSSTTLAAPGGFIVEDPEPGGFLVEDDVQPGGFVVEDEAHPRDYYERDDTSIDNTTESANVNEEENRLSLSLIPHALQLLDLQPDDEDVLGVFRHAASEWEDKSRSIAHSDPSDEQFVSRKDWRAVCAALLYTNVGDEDDPPQSAEPQLKDPLDEGGDLTPLESSDSGDEYQGSEPEGESSEVDDDASDDEYQEGGFIVPKSKGKKSTPSTPTRARTRSSRKAGRSLSVSGSEDGDDNELPRPLTARQRVECRRAFALFFPDVPDAQLNRQRIMIKDITRVAKLLKEKVTADETMEMLEMFSTSADKSMSLQDFERMMLAAKLA